MNRQLVNYLLGGFWLCIGIFFLYLLMITKAPYFFSWTWKDFWPQLVATIIGVYFALNLDRKERKKSEVDSFKRIMPALIIEAGFNLAGINSMRQNLRANNYYIIHFQKELLKKSLTERGSYYYLSEEYFYTAYTCLRIMDVIETRLQLGFEKIRNGEDIPQYLVTTINENADDLEKALTILQHVIQNYVNIFGVKLGPKFDKEPFLSKLKHLKEQKLDDLQKERETVSDFSDKQIQDLRLGYEKALEETHKKH